MASMRLKLSRRGLIALITLLLAGFAGLLWQLAPQSYALWGSYGGLTLALLLLLGRYLQQLDQEVDAGARAGDLERALPVIEAIADRTEEALGILGFSGNKLDHRPVKQQRVFITLGLL